MFSERLKKARKNKKYTQESLAKKLNTTKGTISNYENGHSTPSNEMLVMLADILDVTVDYLLGRDSFITQFKDYRKRRKYLEEKEKEYQLSDTEYSELDKLIRLIDSNEEGFVFEEMQELDRLHALNTKLYKNEKDIAKRLEQFKEELENTDGLAFDGEPMSDEAKESLLESMELLFRQTQRINKKFTPKKYREDE